MFLTDDYLVLVMEYAAGGDLFKVEAGWGSAQLKLWGALCGGKAAEQRPAALHLQRRPAGVCNWRSGLVAVLAAAWREQGVGTQLLW